MGEKTVNQILYYFFWGEGGGHAYCAPLWIRHWDTGIELHLLSKSNEVYKHLHF